MVGAQVFVMLFFYCFLYVWNISYLKKKFKKRKIVPCQPPVLFTWLSPDFTKFLIWVFSAILFFPLLTYSSDTTILILRQPLNTNAVPKVPNDVYVLSPTDTFLSYLDISVTSYTATNSPNPSKCGSPLASRPVSSQSLLPIPLPLWSLNNLYSLGFVLALPFSLFTYSKWLI